MVKLNLVLHVKVKFNCLIDDTVINSNWRMALWLRSVIGISASDQPGVIFWKMTDCLIRQTGWDRTEWCPLANFEWVELLSALKIVCSISCSVYNPQEIVCSITCSVYNLHIYYVMEDWLKGMTSASNSSRAGLIHV